MDKWCSRHFSSLAIQQPSLNFDNNSLDDLEEMLHQCRLTVTVIKVLHSHQTWVGMTHISWIRISFYNTWITNKSTPGTEIDVADSVIDNWHKQQDLICFILICKILIPKSFQWLVCFQLARMNQFLPPKVEL